MGMCRNHKFSRPRPDAHLLQWKKYLTTMQIVQFVIDLFIVYFGSAWYCEIHCGSSLLRRSLLAYSYFAHTYWQWLPNRGSCAGTESAALFGCFLLTSYLGLFINFYIQTYKKPVRGKKAHVVGNGTVNGNGNG